MSPPHQREGLADLLEWDLAAAVALLRSTAQELKGLDLPGVSLEKRLELAIAISGQLQAARKREL